MANDANKAEAYEVGEAIVADVANKANVINEIIPANKTIVTAGNTTRSLRLTRPL